MSDRRALYADSGESSGRVRRRTFLGALGVAVAVGGSTAAASAVLPGGRTEGDEGGEAAGRKAGRAQRPLFIGTFGGGIVTGSYDTSSGAISTSGAVEDVTSPTFLALSKDGTVLYALDEASEEGTVRAYAVGDGGKLSPLGEPQSTGGNGVTHLSVHASGEWLLSANYGSGSVAVHPIKADGALGARTDLVQHEGKGPDPERQEGPHAHQIVSDPKGGFVIAVDLGTDSLFSYRLDAEKGTLKRVAEAKAEPGAGPRHLAFHPDGGFAYVANELDSTITVYAYDAGSGTFTRGDSISTLPEGEEPGVRNFPAEVVVAAGGRTVYVSNRGADSVAWMSVGGGGESLKVVGAVACGGDWPRHISIPSGGDVLWAGNEKSGTIGIFAVDEESGALKKAGEPVTVTKPVCVLPG
ncbi:lactonase family protein [Streptomyces sp. Amel2xB2]|uniref:lactonase family protein n=1 Tax=Streptomyces sp. Amel2xB2 TaxID=1305829 RepID=UPI000DB97582|nr:lactonase family protein [Streptomyces sp. Amel2xB2]